MMRTNLRGWKSCARGASWDLLDFRLDGVELRVLDFYLHHGWLVEHDKKRGGNCENCDFQDNLPSRAHVKTL